MVHFVGAGPGAEDLITLRGHKLLCQADLVIWAGSLVNPALLQCCKPGCRLLDSASMTLNEIVEAMEKASRNGQEVVRLHTGDPSIFGAIREQMDALKERGISYEVVPGVSSAFAAAAVLQTELTLPGISQTVIFTRMSGRTPVPEKQSPASLAKHGASLVFFLSVAQATSLAKELMDAGMSKETPVAIVYRASWPDEEIRKGTLEELPRLAASIGRQALILIGDFLGEMVERSKLYDPAFSHGYRQVNDL